LLAGTTSSSASGSPWQPPGLGGGGGTNFINLAVRPGVDKITFKQVNFFGIFLPVTNRYVDIVVNVTNNRVVSQRLERILVQPDILFAAGDLGVTPPGGAPVLSGRTVISGWINNSALNDLVVTGLEQDGPGVITPPVAIIFSNIGPFLQNQNPGFLDQLNSGFFGGWAAFDGTTNEPVVFPNGATIMQLEQRLLGSGF
jgi:hypothetical protein